ncbi:hypothetical protein Sliba_67070 [Streptomyces nigrescens]|uniref:Uncharacterized protein n=1 Tax=Streptomyces nigrescens TaxID=1920 RepID=A0A640TSP1_STRNI|nr:hypothetical protein Sliba_67070 [Streptomyces libani subsp. libani]GGV97871.1 hypothetical protein GCM10010500_44460 [Streptomyces libani subsp. libani]
MWIRTKLTDAELSVALYAATGIVTRPKLMENFAVGRMGAAFIGAIRHHARSGGGTVHPGRCRVRRSGGGGLRTPLGTAAVAPPAGFQPGLAVTRPSRTASWSAW